MKTILVDAVDCFVDREGNIFEEMHKILDVFPNRKIILTGANDEQMIKFGLNNMPYEVFTLKHDPEKTESKYYTIMLDNFKLKPEDVIYFEHSMEAVKSAQSVGINTFYYDNDKKELELLRMFISENLK